MEFVYTYRNNKGEKVTGHLSAKNRAEVFTALRENNISPLSVFERSNATIEDGIRRRLIARYGIFTALIIALLGLCFYYLRPKMSGSDNPVNLPQPRRVLKRNVDKKGHVHKVVNTNHVEVIPTTIPEMMAAAREKWDMLPVAERKRLQDEYLIKKYGKLPKEIRPNLHRKNAHPSPFKHVSEKEIDRIISWEPGHPLIGGFASGLIDRDFAESLNDPIVITEDDSQEDKEKKQRMIEVKRQLLEAVNRGESVDAILEEARKELRSLATYRNNLAKELRELKKGGATEQEIEDFYAAANTMLKEKNIKPMLSPLKIKEKILAVQAERLDK